MEDILWPFGLFCYHLVNFMFFWYIFSLFGMLKQEKSGNPASVSSRRLRLLISLNSPQSEFQSFLRAGKTKIEGTAG
jgi:hypothetical protein